MYIKQLEKLQLSISQISPMIPDIQRKLNTDAIESIYTSEHTYYNHYKTYLLPGCISIAKCSTGEYLVDGQHRIQAYRRLVAEYPERILTISVDYYTIDDNSIDKLFERVNLCTPNTVTILGVDKYKIIQQIERYFNTNFSKYISTAKKPNAPNLSMEQISSWIVDKSLIEITGWSGDMIINQIIELNRWYAKCSDKQFDAWKVNKNYIEKVKRYTNQLYLSVYRCGEWVDILIHMHHGYKLESLNHYSATWKPTISKSLREKVWSKSGCKLIEQGCYCCKETISVNDFECGHIEAAALGGLTTLANLEPICRKCNQDMRCMNMLDYIKLLAEQALA